jgi:hypothetical protein
MTTILPDATIRLNAELDLVAAGLSADEADDFAVVYRKAAAAICEGVAEATVERVAGGEGDPVGCDQEWAEEYGLWQAAHDCCRREDDQWSLDTAAVERHRAGLRRWMVRTGIVDPIA